MVYIGTTLKVIDNSGARYVKCLNIKKKNYRNRATIGDLLLVSVKIITPNKKVKRGVLYKGIVVRLRVKILKYGGFFVKFDSNAMVLLNLRSILLGTRVLGPVSSKLRDFGYFKVISLSPAVF